MRVALLTGGGDCPGLNAVIYAAVKKGINHYGDEFIGFLNGWRGVLDNNFIPLTLESTDGIQLKGGTILHSSRTNVKKIPGGIEKVQEVLKAQQDRRADRAGRRRHAVGDALPERARRAQRGRSQDHRQRHQRDR
jgi:6-phosphofructokinase